MCTQFGAKRVTYDPVMNIVSARLKMCRITLSEKIMADFERTISRIPVKYPIMQTEIKRFVIEKNSLSAVFDNVFPTSQIPATIFCAFFTETALNGSYLLNPLKMGDNKIMSFGCFLDGLPIPQAPLNLDYSSTSRKEGMQGFMSMFNTLNMYNQDVSNGINLNMYDNGYTVFCFSLTKSAGANNPNTPSPSRYGVVRLESTFAEGTPDTLYMLVVTKTPTVLLIDRTRQISFEKH